MQLNLYLLHIHEANEWILKEAIGLLPLNAQRKILKNKSLRAQWKAALSELLLRKVLAEELNIAWDSIKIDSGIYGKPVLRGEKRHFNLSHSYEIIILATDDTPLGIDIEYVRPLNDLDNLLANFSLEEQFFYQTVSPEQRTGFFYDLWTLKESYIKAIGTGFNCKINSFTIKILEEGASFLYGSPDLDVAWFFKRYAFDGHYKCAVCARHNKFPNKAFLVQEADLAILYS